jgi:hypothetical protein
MGLHGANAYPRELAKAEAVLRDAQRTWFDICKEGREVVPKRIPCDKSREEVGLDPRRLALERSLHIVLSDTLHTVNPFYWLGCSTGSQCYYVLLKCVDAVFSSLFVGVSVVAVVLCAGLYVLVRGPLQSYSALQWETALRAHKKELEPAPSDIKLTLVSPPPPLYTETPRK